MKFFIPNTESRKSLAHKLKLKYDESMQDWEYEIADTKRISEFIQEYDKAETTVYEKQSLMEIILDSTNHLLIDKNNKEFNDHFPQIIDRLKLNHKIHEGSLNYWLEGNFDISILIKKDMIHS